MRGIDDVGFAPILFMGADIPNETRETLGILEGRHCVGYAERRLTNQDLMGFTGFGKIFRDYDDRILLVPYM